MKSNITPDSYYNRIELIRPIKKTDVAKNLLKMKPTFLAPSRPRMNESNTWLKFGKPSYNENTKIQKNLILNMKM